MEDRLSELPDSLILVILSLLPVSDVVKTTLLSKRWKDLWTAVPCLDFSWYRNRAYNRFNPDKFRTFVSGALALCNGAKIQKFSIGFHRSHAFDIGSWLPFPFEKQVEELHLTNVSGYCGEYRFCYHVPQSLYSCSSLRKLCIDSCTLQETVGSVQWSKLKSLTIAGKESFTEHGLNQILAGSPVLEELDLVIVEDIENLNIRSSSLKLLKITRQLALFDLRDVKKDAVLTIWAPALETLQMSGDLYESCLLNAPSLTTAILDVWDRYYYYIRKRYYLDSLLEEKLVQFLLIISHAENLTLSEWIMKVLLSLRKRKGMLVPLSNATSVKLYACATDEIIGVLDLFPKLMLLIVDFVDGMPQNFNTDLWFEEHPAVEFDDNNPSCSLLNLRRVEITWTLRDASIIRVIEVLLQNASILKDMVFHATSSESVPGAFSAAQRKVLSMPRASPTAKVNLCRW